MRIAEQFHKPKKSVEKRSLSSTWYPQEWRRPAPVPSRIGGTGGRLRRNSRTPVTALVFLFSTITLSCTIQKTVTISIMTKKKTQTIQFYNKYNRHEYTSPGTKTGEESLTQPGEGITIAEMLRMSARGEIPPMAMSAFHGYNVDIDEVDGTLPQDLTDIENKVTELNQLKEKAKAEKAVRENQVKDEAKKSPNEVAETKQAKSETRTSKAEAQDKEHDS